MIPVELRNRGKRLVSGLLKQDWPNDPTYLMHTSEFGEAGRSINGFACRKSYLFRAALGDNWEGPGRIIMVNDTNLIRKSEGRGKEYLQHLYLAVLTHEASHCVQFELDPSDSDRNLAAELCYEIGKEFPLGTAASMVTDMDRPIAESAAVRREYHEADWHRCVVHCHWRAFHHHGHLLLVDQVCYGGECYGLSPGGDYMRALLPECRERANEPIRDILASPMPTAFAELWERDAAIEREEVQ